VLRRLEPTNSTSSAEILKYSAPASPVGFPISRKIKIKNVVLSSPPIFRHFVLLNILSNFVSFFLFCASASSNFA